VREEVVEAFKKILSLLLIVVALSFLTSFVNSLDFSNTGLSGFIGISKFEINPQEEIPPEGKNVEPYRDIPVSFSEESLANLHKSFNPPQIPTFFVENLNRYTNRLRLYTAVDYENGEWLKEKADYSDRVAVNPTGYVTNYRVTPIREFSTHIPVSKDTAFVTAPAKYDKETGTYFIKENLSQPYDAFSTAWKVEDPGVVEKDERYTKISLSAEDKKKLKTLAEEITINALTDYEKLLAIEEYLEENYEYDPNYTPPPENVEPVMYFLFESKKGVCKEFASAFVLLARSLDIPARAVFGYNARPIPANQTVMESQRHMWAEVKFSSGWIEFDPTPPPKNLLETVTEITYSDPTARKNSSFTVRGYVKTKDGFRVRDGYVEIFLKKDKNETGVLLGILELKRGRFDGKVKVPDVAGKFHVVAHYVGSVKYKESWSDPIIRIYSPPELSVEIPDRMAVGIPFKLRGKIVDENGTALSNATIFLRVNKKVVSVTTSDSNGFFELTLKIDEEGFHSVSVEYPGSEFVLPMSKGKIVEVGKIELFLENKSVVKGKEWISEGKILFRDKPLKKSLVRFYRGDFEVNAITDEYGNFTVKGKIPKDFDLGKVDVNFTVKGIGFEDSVQLSVKAETEMDVSVRNENNKVYIYVMLREKGRNVPAFGIIKIGNRSEETNPSGVAVFEYDTMPSESVAVFEGNEKYLPTSKEFNTFSIPYWALSAIVPLVIYFLLYRKKIFSKKIVIEIDREQDDLPLVWDVNETIKIRVKNYGKGILRVLINGEKIGEHEKGLEIEVAFEEEGVNILKAERVVEGEVKETVEVEINIMSYRKAIIMIFSNLVKELERKESIDLSDYTAREILRMFKILNGTENKAGRNLLRLFELSKYGMRSAERKEFLSAFNFYKQIRGDIIEK
jgi:transglutaminase-like putative cysteine protease